MVTNKSQNSDESVIEKAHLLPYHQPKIRSMGRLTKKVQSNMGAGFTDGGGIGTAYGPAGS